MKSLVINAGSSSVKFQLFEDEKTILSGLCEEIGNVNSKIKLKEKGEKREIIIKFENHKQAFQEIIKILQERNMVSGLSQIVHRVVHGGEKFKKPTIISKETILELKKLIPLAPLHNPANIDGIELMEELLPKVQQVAIFDTSFHSTLPEEAYLYGVPYSWYKEHGVRRYGFHGSSHEYVSKEAAKLLENSNARIITCHLGNGASVCAIKNGRSIDTSMGMTPLEGNVMGTRSGSIDPAIIFYIMNEKKLTHQEMDKILNKESGLKGLSELTSDMRILLSNLEKSDQAKRALGVYLHTLLKIIGSYLAVMNGVDAIVFTGGVGENNALARDYIAEHLSFLGIKIDEKKNKNNEVEISDKESKVKVFVIPTNEELQMVRNAKQLLKK